MQRSATRFLPALLALFATLPASADNLFFDGTAGDDTFEIVVTGPKEASFFLNGALILSEVGLSGINFDGGDGSDTLILNQSTASLMLFEGLFFNGGDGAAGFDSLIINGGATGLASFVFENASDGRIEYGGSTITYTGLEPISYSMTADRLVFDYRANGVDTITLGDGPAAADGRMFIDSTNGESVDFLLPLMDLVILADDNDVIDVGQLDAVFDRSRLLINPEIPPVPLPAAVWFFISGFIAVAGLAKSTRNRGPVPQLAV